jgi:hypothetical protein
VHFLTKKTLQDSIDAGKFVDKIFVDEKCLLVNYEGLGGEGDL